VAALIDFGFDPQSVTPDMFNQNDRMTQMGREPNRVDILQNINGVNFSDCHSRRTFTEIDGSRIPMISLSDLLINKLATARPQDIADARQLEKIISARAKKINQ
jgi:predicted nucleotidyltransferase